MSLDMFGFIDPSIESGTATRLTRAGGEYVDGIWVAGTTAETTHSVVIQPMNDREAENLGIGGKRIKEYLKLYVNDGTMGNIRPSDYWQINGEFYNTYRLDNRPTRNYCKAILVRRGNQ